MRWSFKSFLKLAPAKIIKKYTFLLVLVPLANLHFYSVVLTAHKKKIDKMYLYIIYAWEMLNTKFETI